MGKTNFNTLQELAQSLTKKIDKLANGNLPIDDLDQVTNSAKEIYERLIIIRYKFYEDINGLENEVVLNEEGETEVNSESINIDNQNDNSDEMMMFDFSEAEESSDESENESTTTNSDVIDVQDEDIDSSLNDSYKKEDKSVGKKLSKSAISDLKSHIGINRKFSFISDLFNGNNEAYNHAINSLNTCDSRTEAFTLLEEIKTNQNWDDEHQTVANFIALIDRRYLS